MHADLHIGHRVDVESEVHCLAELCRRNQYTFGGALKRGHVRCCVRGAMLAM